MKDILARIDGARRVFLFLDYDGTLVLIKRTPGLALLRRGERDFLRRLSERAFLCIVSGRSLDELQRLVAIESIAYIGNHGLEILCGQRHWVHPQAKRIEPVLKAAVGKIHHWATDVPGILVEDKGATASIHYRLADPALWSPLKAVVGKEVGLKPRALKMTEGKRVYEIKPNLPWNKGKGIRKLMGWLDLRERPLLIYIGDDQTDEDAFRVVNRMDQSAVTIHVGRMRDTQARFRLVGVNEVWMFLEALFPRLARPC
jgi:trehalose-phosphatase